MRNINEYEVFKTSYAFTLEIYQTSKLFPKEEIYGLTTQIRRAAYSIPMNLKEGSVGTEKWKELSIKLNSIGKMLYSILNKKKSKK